MAYSMDLLVKTQQIQDVDPKQLYIVAEAFELTWLSSMKALDSMDEEKYEDDSHLRIWKAPKTYFSLSHSVPLSTHRHHWFEHFDKALRRSAAKDVLAEHMKVKEVLDLYLAKAKASWAPILDDTLVDYPYVKAYVTEAYPEIRCPPYYRVPSLSSVY
jgi:hypothetical protein